MTLRLRQLYPSVKARASSGWERFVLSVLQMAVPTGGSMLARPPCRPLAVRPAVGIADSLADGCFSRAAVRQPDRTPYGGGRPYGRSHRRSAWSCARGKRPSALAVCYGRPPGRLPGRLSGRLHGGRPPPSPSRPHCRPPGRPLRGRPPASSPRPATPLLHLVDLLRQRYSQRSNFR